MDESGQVACILDVNVHPHAHRIFSVTSIGLMFPSRNLCSLGGGGGGGGGLGTRFIHVGTCRECNDAMLLY